MIMNFHFIQISLSENADLISNVCHFKMILSDPDRILICFDYGLTSR